MSLKQENLSDKELVVGSIRVLQNVNGAGIDKITRKIDDLQKTTQTFLAKQNNYWKDLIQDGVINPIEKQTLYKEWQVIDRTYTAIMQQATDEDVLFTDEIIEYKAAYEKLKNYLFEEIRVFDNLNENTKITNREEFNEQYLDYYEKEQYTQVVLNTGMAGKPGHIRILDSLLGIGYVGEVAIYGGRLYTYDGTTWLEIEGSSYLGILNETPDIKIIGTYFLAGENNFLIPMRLSILAKDLVTKGVKYVVAKVKAQKGYIYIYEKTGWRKITNKDDYHYISAINDLLSMNEELSPKLQTVFNEINKNVEDLQEEVTKLNGDYESINEQLQINNDSWQAAFNGVYEIIDGTLLDENGKPIDIDGKIQITENQILNVVDGKILNVNNEVAKINGQITIINGDVTEIKADINSLQTELGNKVEHIPEYLGASTNISPEAQIGDWYLYTGPTVTGTQSRKINVMYKKVDGNIWQELDATDISTHKYYMQGLTDVLNNVKDLNDGYFNVIFAKALMTNAATITALQSQVITLIKAFEDTDGTQSGIIRSQNFLDTNGLEGWQIKADGEATFKSGNFDNAFIKKAQIQNSSFSGALDCGSLQVKKTLLTIKFDEFSKEIGDPFERYNKYLDLFGIDRKQKVDFTRNITTLYNADYYKGYIPDNNTEIEKIRIINTYKETKFELTVIGTESYLEVYGIEFNGNPIKLYTGTIITGINQEINGHQLLSLEIRKTEDEKLLLYLENLPTNEPTESGVIWNSDGILKIS